MTRVVLLRLVIHTLLTYIHGANSFPLLNGSSQSSDFDARSDAADSPKPSALSTGAIVGIVVTGTLAVITTSLAAVCCVTDAKRRRRVARTRSAPLRAGNNRSAGGAPYPPSSGYSVDTSRLSSSLSGYGRCVSTLTALEPPFPLVHLPPAMPLSELDRPAAASSPTLSPPVTLRQLPSDLLAEPSPTPSLHQRDYPEVSTSEPRRSFEAVVGVVEVLPSPERPPSARVKSSSRLSQS